jgi:hypothetical protein
MISMGSCYLRHVYNQKVIPNVSQIFQIIADYYYPMTGTLLFTRNGSLD